MITKTAKISKDDLQKLGQIDVSLQHWQSEYCNMMLNAKNMLSNIDSLHQAKHQILGAAYKEAGVNPASVVQASINKEGVISLMCHPDAPSGPPIEIPAASNGVANGASPEAAPAPAEGSPTS